MYKYFNTNLYFPNRKYYLPEKRGEKPQLKNQATVLSELRSIRFAEQNTVDQRKEPTEPTPNLI